MDLRGRKVAVVGMERSGLASAELALNSGAWVTAADQRPFDQLSPAVQALRERGVTFGLQSEVPFERFDMVVLSPGVPADLPELAAARAAGIPVIGEVELAGHFLRGRVIGITGSNGKTTTTALIGHILKECGTPSRVGGNIGTPVTAMVANSRDDEWDVLELSSFQLETTLTFAPDIAIILNITQNHLDRHYTMEKYADAKARILDQQTADDWAILNANDPFCRGFAARGAARRLWFSSVGEAAGLRLERDEIVLNGELVMRAGDVPIRGRHNLENAMAAIGAASLAGVPLEGIAGAVRSFHAVEHRLEFVTQVRGVNFYNDSKATSVDAALKALDAFEEGLWVILGGKDKGSDYTPLRAPLAAKAKAALLIGSAAKKIESQLESALPLIPSGTLEAAVNYAFEHALPGDTILLAPACASFDQFQSYEHRGRVFKEQVRALASEDYGSAA